MGIHYQGPPEELRALDAYVKLLRAASSVGARLDESLRKLGLKGSQLGLLEMLLHLGPLQQHEIGQKLLLSRANITLLVDRLVERRWVRRERDPEDRRAFRIHLTPEGRKRIARAFPVHARAIAQAFGVLSHEEQRELARLCKKLGLANAAAREG